MLEEKNFININILTLKLVMLKCLLTVFKLLIISGIENTISKEQALEELNMSLTDIVESLFKFHTVI